MATDQNFSGFYQENKKLLKEYVDLRLRLVKLRMIKVLSRALGLVIVAFIACAFVMLIAIFLGMAFAWWLADKTGSNIIGFAGTGAVFIILLLLIMAFRKPLFITPLIRMFIEESTKDLHETE